MLGLQFLQTTSFTQSVHNVQVPLTRCPIKCCLPVISGLVHVCTGTYQSAHCMHIASMGKFHKPSMECLLVWEGGAEYVRDKEVAEGVYVPTCGQHLREVA